MKKQIVDKRKSKIVPITTGAKSRKLVSAKKSSTMARIKQIAKSK